MLCQKLSKLDPKHHKLDVEIEDQHSDYQTVEFEKNTHNYNKS